MTTQRTIASSEELNQMPPSPAKACMLCWRQEADGVLLLRCGTCKNQVYCGAECQGKDWKTHKQNCSELPIGQLAYMAPLSEAQAIELRDEVQRVANVLAKWASEHEGLGRNSELVSKLSANNDIANLRLATPYSSSVYTRVRPQDKAFTFRVQLLLITRLFLIHLVSPSPLNPIEVVDKRRSNFVGIVTASHRGQIWAPKVACRPGDLSPGEYLVLPEFLHMMAVEEQWNLTGGKMEAPEGQSDDEKAFASRFANLVEISNELWDVKM